MQFAVERHLLENVAAISLERRAEVVNVDAAQLGHHPVGDARRDAAHPEIVDANFAPSADDVVSGRNLFQEQRNVGGIVLQVAIHGDDVFPAGVIEACGQSGGLSEIAAQLDDCDAAIDCGDLAKLGECVVARSIVDQDDLKRLAVVFHYGLQAVIEIGDVLLLVVQGDDDGVLGHGLFIIA